MGPLNNFQRLSILVTASASPELKEKFVDIEKVGRWVAAGDEWALYYEYDFFDKEQHPLTATVEETFAILGMYRFLQKVTVESLEKVGLTAESVVFPGFDGNNDKHYHIASVIVDELKRFRDVEGATANSHLITSIDRYRRMLEKFKVIYPSPANWVNVPLTAEDVVKILE